MMFIFTHSHLAPYEFRRRQCDCESVMEELRRIDLTYITERIISLSCPPECHEDTYLRNLQEIIHMLQSKHGHDYMVRATRTQQGS